MQVSYSSAAGIWGDEIRSSLICPPDLQVTREGDWDEKMDRQFIHLHVSRLVELGDYVAHYRVRNRFASGDVLCGLGYVLRLVFLFQPDDYYR